MGDISLNEWEQFLQAYPEAHLLQSSSWARLKTAFGWQPGWIISHSDGLEIGAQILFRRVLPGFFMAYIPKGPVYNQTSLEYPPPTWSKFWQLVDQLCQKKRAAFLKVEPDLWEKREAMFLESSNPGQKNEEMSLRLPIHPRVGLPPPGFRIGTHTIQPSRTMVVRLEGGEDQVLSRMKQKTRYNIKLAQKRGVSVCASSDIPAFHKMMKITGERDGFSVHSQEYFQKVYDLFYPSNECELFFAEFQNELLASLMVFARGRRAWYFYGASSNEHRDLMATYLIQWHAMRWAQTRGCTEYDLWGVPDLDFTQLEANFANTQNKLWGVYRFKRGFGGELYRSAGPWDRVYQPLIYAAYRWRTRKHLEGLGRT